MNEEAQLIAKTAYNSSCKVNVTYSDNVDSSNSLSISNWWYIFVGPAGSLRFQDTVGLDATLEADLVPIGEKLGDGAFTFCFNGAGRGCGGSGTGIEAGIGGMGSLGMMSCCTGFEARYLGFRCSFILQRADPS